jgi:hypothetical protein
MRNFIFDEIKKKKINTKIIGEGEVTGHMHRLQENDNALVYKTLEDECLLLKVLDKPAKVTHEEHNSIDILPGNFRVTTIQEKDHVNDIVRKVRD